MIKKMLRVSLMGWACTALAQETLQTLDWGELAKQGRVLSGYPTPISEEDPTLCLGIESADDGGGSFPILVLEDLEIEHLRFAMLGNVSGQDIEGKAYLEMWSVFADGSRYFTRTIGIKGPLKVLEGSFDWRPFQLPFMSKEGGPFPNRLELNLVFQGKGTVRLGPLKLVGFGNRGGAIAKPTRVWWSSKTAGWVFGLAGAFLGGIGLAIGILAALGKGRGFVLHGLRLVLVFGVAFLAVGIYSLVRAQPFNVFYPLLLFGVVCLASGGPMLAGLKKRYRSLEFHKMKALDTEP